MVFLSAFQCKQQQNSSILEEQVRSTRSISDFYTMSAKERIYLSSKLENFAYLSHPEKKHNVEPFRQFVRKKSKVFRAKLDEYLKPERIPFAYREIYKTVFPDYWIEMPKKNWLLFVAALLKYEKMPSDNQVLTQLILNSGPIVQKFFQLIVEYLEEGTLKEQLLSVKNQLPAVPFKFVQEAIETNYPDGFITLRSEKPIGVASVGQVYIGQMRNGFKIVLKVLKPGIESAFENDSRIILSLLNVQGTPSVFVKNTIKSLREEIDLRVEYANLEELGSRYKKYSKKVTVVAPIGDKFRNTLVMNLAEGKPLSQLLKEKSGLQAPKATAKSMAILIAAWIDQALLESGKFHADLHSGNIFVSKNGLITLIDFGMIDTLLDEDRDLVVYSIYSLLRGRTNDAQKALNELIQASGKKVPSLSNGIEGVRDFVRFINTSGVSVSSGVTNFLRTLLYVQALIKDVRPALAFETFMPALKMCGKLWKVLRRQNEASLEGMSCER